MNKTKFTLLVSIFLVFYGCSQHSSTPIEERLENDLSADNIPILSIQIEDMLLDSIHKSQKIKVYADAVLVTSRFDTIYDGSIKIKTRGNSTFLSDTKKPYNITLVHKQDLLGLYKSKSFCLLANNLDRSCYISNAIAFDLAHSLGLPAPKYAYVHLYMNGKYKGLYQLTNKIEVNPYYLPIRKLEKENKQLNPLGMKHYAVYADKKDTLLMRKGVILEEPEDITGGYILDHTGAFLQYRKDPSGFISDKGEMIRIRAPKYASINEVNYIADLYNQMEEAVYSNNGFNTRTGKYYTQYIDIESFAKYYLIQELLQHCDAGVNSFMMYKDADDIDSLIHAGPIWDFDLFVANEKYLNVLYASAETGKSGGLLHFLWTHSDFRQQVKRTYIEEVYPKMNNLLSGSYIDSLQNLLAVDTEVAPYLRKRSDFLYWLWTADSTDVVCVQIMNSSKYERAISIYGNKQDGVRLPQYPIVYNHDPELIWTLEGSNEPLPADTVFYTNQNVVMHWYEPNWLKVQQRRIRKKFYKIFK